MKIFILASLLVASVALNVYFLLGNGIQVTNYYKQYQNQQQAQLVFGLQGKEGCIEWHVAKPSDPMEFLNTLSPEQALFAKFDRTRVVYPVLSTHEKVAPAPQVAESPPDVRVSSPRRLRPWLPNPQGS